MSDIVLRDYQTKLYRDIAVACKTHKKVVAFLPTGGGKSILIGKLAEAMPGRTLILTHRIEILKQNAEKIKNVAILSSKENTMRYDTKVIVAMVQTLHARIERNGPKYLGQIDNILLDEVQVLIFEKVVRHYNPQWVIGFTGTPVLNKIKNVTIDGVDYTEPYTLSELFDTLVQGPDSQLLIDRGFLVQDYNITLTLPTIDLLVESNSNPDGYTSKSLNEVYSNTASLRILLEAYEKYGKGKKTLMFNANTKINKLIYKNFYDRGHNVKMFDSVNKTETNPATGKPYTREEIIEWFRGEKDAILINTNVFTTGFDVDDVETVIVNRATKSLALWIQMVGRGSRITNKIYKDKFTVIDLGENISKHGVWSEKRDWNKYFYSPGLRPKNTMDMLSTWICDKCQAINVVGEIECFICGADKPDAVRNGKKLNGKEGTLTVVGSMPLPRAKSILDYTRRLNESSNFAFKLLENRILEMFIHYKIKKPYYEANKATFRKNVAKMYKPIYFAIIRARLKGSRKTLATQLKKMNSKIDKLYEY